MIFAQYSGDTQSATCHAAVMNDESEPDDSDVVDGKQQWSTVPDSFWRSLESATTPEADAELTDWLTTQHGVAIRSHGGFAPEYWAGDVDGHSFTFRERHGLWSIEIDHQPSGQFIKQVTGTEPDGSATYRTRELEVGKLVASGTTDVAGYGTEAIERAQFIVDTIRTYLTRQTCSHHLGKLHAIDDLLGVPAHWCPSCGTHLPGR